MAFTTPGMTEQGLQTSMNNTSQEANLWLNSNKIAALIYGDMGLVKKSNPECTYTHKITTEIVKAITKEAEVNLTVVE